MDNINILRSYLHTTTSTTVAMIMFLLATSFAVSAMEETTTAPLKRATDKTLDLPLWTIGNLSYKGAFRMGTQKKEGHADSKFASAVFELSADGSSFFFGGRKVDTILGEFNLPELVKSDNIQKLNMASVRQNYASILGTRASKYEAKRLAAGNEQKLDRITGIKLAQGKLIINASRYYDAPARTSHTTLILEDSRDLANSKIRGPYSVEGAAHASGWISEIPEQWQSALGANTIMGWASNFPISGRNSIGPSAFGINIDDLLSIDSNSGDIDSIAYLDFSLKQPLHDDKHNNRNTTTKNNASLKNPPEIVGDNDLWTVLSRAGYGFIIPNTSTYAVFGSSGGHRSGIGYKIKQNNGNQCNGFCAADYDDYYNYYWLFDVRDLLEVKQGKMKASDIRPYDYGILDAPFQDQNDISKRNYYPIRPVRGGDFDHNTNTLYLVLGGPIHKQQIIIAYDIDMSK
jgi:hypothetical protein